MAESISHGEPSGECLVCYDDLSKENYVEYRTRESGIWYPSKFCYCCIQEIQKTQFKRYCDGVANSTCAKEQKALLRRGPPINIYDANGFPECGNDEVSALWSADDNSIKSAKLDGSLEGEARDRLWQELRQFLIEGEPDEEKDKDDGKK